MLIPPELFIIEESKPEAIDLYENIEFNDEEVAVIKSDFHDIKVLKNNIGKFVMFEDTYQAGLIDTAFYQGNLPYINYFLLSYLMTPKIENILLIGMGTGKVINDFEKLVKDPIHIDIVDIDPNVFDIACNHFGFEKSENTDFYIQDGRVFLRESDKKYDVIIVDIAGNEGIPYRYMTKEFLEEVREKLSDSGVLISNMFSSAHFGSSENIILKSFVQTFKGVFENVALYRADYSDELFYKSFFNHNDRIIDITNALFFASKRDIFQSIELNAKSVVDKFDSIGIKNIQKYVKDSYKGQIYFQEALVLSDEFLNDSDFDLQKILLGYNFEKNI